MEIMFFKSDRKDGRIVKSNIFFRIMTLLFIFMYMHLSAYSEQITVVLEEPGTLSQHIGEGKWTITDLKIVGFLNGDDMYYLREMAGRDSECAKTKGVLAYLDLYEAHIVDGGTQYYVSHFGSNYAVSCVANQISWFAFDECESLKSIKLPVDTKKIGRDAFWCCNGLTQINLGSELESIDYYAFDCTSLKEVTLPATLRNIGPEGIVAPIIHCNGTTPPTCSSSTFSTKWNNLLENTKLYVPRGFKQVYESAIPWKYCSEIIEEDIVTGIPVVKKEERKDIKIYNIQGQFVGNSLKELPKGVYILNGRKVLVK